MGKQYDDWDNSPYSDVQAVAKLAMKAIDLAKQAAGLQAAMDEKNATIRRFQDRVAELELLLERATPTKSK